MLNYKVKTFNYSLFIYFNRKLNDVSILIIKETVAMFQF